MKKIKEITPKKWGLCAVILLVVLVMGMALLTYIVDPYFHYHGPVKGISYRLYEQQYINDGIARHFEYDTIIIGNSLSENMQPSQVDELFDCKSIKIPYSGAGYNELWRKIERALEYNDDVKKVFVVVDMEDAAKDKDYVRYTNYPEYLYDDDLWNDAQYLWNKDIFYRGTIYNLLMTITGKESTTFDEYSVKRGETGVDIVLPMAKEIPLTPPESIEYTDKDEGMVRDNINENIISVVKKYPDVEFILIYAPYSIVKWARFYANGEMDYQLKSVHTAIENLVEQENITLYSFQDDFELIGNLDQYLDTIHYTTEVCEYMMEQIAKGKEVISKDNYTEYLRTITDYYMQYDYYNLKNSYGYMK